MAELVGKRVKKEFKGFGFFNGVVSSFDPSTGFFEILYEDGDSEELEFQEISSLLENGSASILNNRQSACAAADATKKKPWIRRRVGDDSGAVGSTFSGRSKETPTSTTVCRPFVKTVCLDKWWLIKVERDSKGRRGLGVAGFALREGQETRAFFSAAIAKRHDTVTLETTDGITIKINGFINRSDTAKNGFPSEVGNRFRSGFPHNWEEYAGRFCSEESGNGAIPSKISNLDGFDGSSVDDSRVLGKSIMNDIMQHFGGNEATGKEKRKDNYGTHPLMTQNFVRKQVPRHHDKTKGDDKCKDDGSSQHSTDRGKVNFQKIAGECETGIDVDSLSGGVMTRSMSRLSNLRNKRENNFSPSTSVTCRVTEVSGGQCGLTVNTGNGSSKRQKTTVSDADVESNGAPRTSTTMRLSRLESLSEPLSKSEVSNNRYGGALSGEEMNAKQIPDKSAVRRSDRLSKIYN
ncbi:uncharacterized protein LOC131316825 isoform X2 [Rhododendron vialii]|uniref:uncharacterized protein LOC131316825 isoform X2 n=1 Tax=Rhododendron vialii TaxID=182163 RepID=UPI00265EB0EE|nr:uncharacterized protein LOC131316825 isoform X2 [Rhododendron vialii]